MLPPFRPGTHLVFFALLLTLPSQALAVIDRDALDTAVVDAGELSRTHTLLVAVEGETVIDRGWRGHATDETANIKSLSKTLISALVGLAIERDIIEGVDQPVVELLGDRVPSDIDPQVNDITVGHLLSMQSGLQRTSGSNYAGWVASPNWVEDALTRPMVGEPGERMRYSTGNSHLLSAALTEASGRSTLALMRDWLGEPLGITIPAWTRDPQGIYFGGNEMGLTPQALLRIAELYRQQGKHDGEQLLTAEWIERSWAPRTRSVFNQDLYGYGWFRTELDDTTVHYGWGYGGQLLFVVPERNMTIVMTSDPTPPSNGSAYLEQVKAVVERMIAATVP
ncbi:serine hydrolase domain-containing protein [Aidingimonas halophila]|uniref:CubicO group peptidase, beta-lactamase class C family n=1 Tax=Aidingimonas halophila TaxID=574349 RepID=A0A1H3GYB9_9GAMM|nr:serine hydrolase [Aidingimonas halophila]GHC36255.1 6-aminohexanoate-dimer hydrolase [Aidingimonas halophila]SDY08272.1 CubicO group peptidase, beta-lactamase class C family [Aidingimonas halophila]